MKDKVKLFIMSMVAVIASLISEKGIPESKDAWIVFAFTILGTALVYNFTPNSKSKKNDLDWWDLLKGLLPAVGGAISNYIATLATGGTVDFPTLGKLVAAVVVGYMVKTFLQNPVK